MGVHDRPPIIAGPLSDAGYHCVHLSTIHWVNSIFGYNDGLARETLLIHPSTLADSGWKLLRWPLSRLSDGDGNHGDFATCKRLISIYLRGMVTFWSGYTDADRIRYSTSIVGQHKFRAVELKEHFCAELDSFETGPAAYVQSAVDHYKSTGTFIADRDWRSYRARGDQFKMLVLGAVERIVTPFSKRHAHALRHRFKSYPDAEAIVDNILDVAEGSRGQPFFIWSHLFDAHIPFSAGSGAKWRSDSSRWLLRAGHRGDIDPLIALMKPPTSESEWDGWRALYDAAVNYVSFHIGRLRSELDRRGMANTLLVISSDHGEELGEHGDIGHKFRQYEHNVRVATFYNHPDYAGRVRSGSSTLLDVGPTICDLVGVKAHPRWEGKSIAAQEWTGDDPVICESFFGSPCDYTGRPIYFACRVGNWKLQYIERPDDRDPMRWSGIRLFDLQQDPMELNDVSRTRGDVVAQIMPLVRARAAQISSENNVITGLHHEEGDSVHGRTGLLEHQYVAAS
jgi:arylsulfatase A-like enzyme